MIFLNARKLLCTNQQTLIILEMQKNPSLKDFVKIEQNIFTIIWKNWKALSMEEYYNAM